MEEHLPPLIYLCLFAVICSWISYSLKLKSQCSPLQLPDATKFSQEKFYFIKTIMFLEAMLCNINKVNNKPTCIQDGVCDSYGKEAQFHHIWRDPAFSLRLTVQVSFSANFCCRLFLMCANSLQMQKTTKFSKQNYSFLSSCAKQVHSTSV